MQDRKGAIQPAAGAGGKPVAPDDLWERLAEASGEKARVKREGEFTAAEYTGKLGVCRTTAQTTLLKMVSEGILVCRSVPGKTGSRVRLYSFKEEK